MEGSDLLAGDRPGAEHPGVEPAAAGIEIDERGFIRANDRWRRRPPESV